MAGVYIANMKMPTVCDECESGFVHTIGCTKRMFFNDRSIARHPECPLLFVPDHGRLIDSDVTVTVHPTKYGPPEMSVRNVLFLQLVGDLPPTIIPSDKEVDHGEV